MCQVSSLAERLNEVMDELGYTNALGDKAVVWRYACVLGEHHSTFSAKRAEDSGECRLSAKKRKAIASRLGLDTLTANYVFHGGHKPGKTVGVPFHEYVMRGGLTYEQWTRQKRAARHKSTSRETITPLDPFITGSYRVTGG